MADEANDKPDSVKRIVLIGYPGSGKTMLAIGLFNSSQRKGATISVKDPTTIDTLSRAVEEIQTNKKFAAATQLIKGTSAEQTERKAYLFDFSWRGKSFRIEFEDYAGERASNPDYLKQFDDIIGAHPHGAILLLNPGMALFKQPSDVPDDKVQGEVKKWAALPKSYTAVVQKLCERGCTNLVLAVTASDRISKGGDLCQTKQYENFKKVLEEIRRSFKNVRTKDGCRLDFKIVYVTVTGRLKYNENGEPEEEHLAEYGASTAADPFLWIIDPWRRWWHKFIRRLAWLVPSAALLLAGMYFGGQAVQRHVVKSNLDKAEDLLGNFGDPESPTFDMKTGTNTIAEAEACLKKANEAWTFLVSEEVKKDRDGRLSTLLGTLMTNQVKLAYVNSPQDASTYFDLNRTLEGRPELASWPYWARSSRGQASHDAALGFRDEKTKELVQATLKLNVEYLEKRLQEATKKLPDDKEIGKLLKNVADSLKKITDERTMDNLRYWQQQVVKSWIESVGKDVPENFESRLRIVFKDETDLNVAETDKAIHRVWLMGERIKALQVVNAIKPRDSAQYAADNLYKYITSSSGSKSPYRWYVFDNCKNKFNQRMNEVLSSPEKRKVGFVDLFYATKTLKKIDGELKKAGDDNLLEKTFGDCALFWMSRELTDNMKLPGDWLRFRFQCDSMWIRTDHLANNPSSKPFKEGVCMTLKLYFSSGGSFSVCWSKKIGEWLAWDEIESDNRDYFTGFRDMGLDKQMEATEVLALKVCDFKEDYFPDHKVPDLDFEFWPGWDAPGDVKSKPYGAEKEYYPNEALFRAWLGDVKITDGPKDSFLAAKRKADARIEAIKMLHNEELSGAEKEIKAEKQSEGVNAHE